MGEIIEMTADQLKIITIKMTIEDNKIEDKEKAVINKIGITSTNQKIAKSKKNKIEVTK